MHARRKERRLSPWARRFALVGVLVGAIAIGWGAVATWFATAPIEGDIETSRFAVSWDISLSETSDVSARVENGKLKITSAYPGGHLIVQGKPITTGGEAGRVVGVTLPGLPENWSASVVDESCGERIDGNNYGDDSILVRIDVGEDAELGVRSTLQGGGLMIAPSSIAPASPTCEPYVGTA